MDKICNGCGEKKPREAFYRNARVKTGIDSRCKACKNKVTIAWQKANVEKKKKTDRDSHIRRFYGLEPEDYEAMLARQGGVCAICLGTNNGKPLHVDHDHKCCAGAQTCGKCLRGLLCSNCNRAIGYLADRPDRAITATMYLMQHTV